MLLYFRVYSICETSRDDPTLHHKVVSKMNETSTINISKSTEASNINGTDWDPDILLKELNDKTALRFLPVILYMGILLVVGTLGNVMVLVVYSRKRIKYSSDYFILNLAFLDLLTCVIGVPVEIADLRYPYMFYAPAACKLLRTVESLSSMGSSLTLMAIARDRYKRICKLGERFSNENAKRLCLGAILVGVLTCWPAGVVFGKKTVDVGIPGADTADCSTADEMRNTIYPLLYYALVMLYFLTCLIFVTFVYVRISIYIRRGRSIERKRKRHVAPPVSSISLRHISEEQTTHTDPGQECDASREPTAVTSNTGSKPKGRMVNTIKVTRTTTIFVVVTVAFIVSYLPFLVVMVTRNIKKNFEDILSPAAEVFYKFCLKSYFINIAINPVIYSFLNRNFRSEVIKVLKCRR